MISMLSQNGAYQMYDSGNPSKLQLPDATYPECGVLMTCLQTLKDLAAYLDDCHRMQRDG